MKATKRIFTCSRCGERAYATRKPSGWVVVWEEVDELLAKLHVCKDCK